MFSSINPADQVGFVNVLNSNTLGHLSLRSNPESVSHQTSHFLIWFGSKVAQERAEREEGTGLLVVMEWSWVERGRAGWVYVGGGGGCCCLMKSWCEQGEEDLVRAYEGWWWRSRRRSIQSKRRASGEAASLGHLCFSCFEELVKERSLMCPLIMCASGTRQAPKWTSIELQVINLWKAPLEHGAFSQAFVFICQDMYSDMRRRAVKELSPPWFLNGGFSKACLGLLITHLSFWLKCSHITGKKNNPSAHLTPKTVELMG